jgi:thiamine kinase-like enzyme
MAKRPNPESRAASLPCWSGKVDPQALSGGITNRNFLVEDRGERFFVRIGEDIPVHGVMRFNERAAASAAEAAGVSPAVVHAQPGALVTCFIEGRTLEAEDIRDPARLPAIVELVRRCHHEIPRQLRGPALIFWVFHVIRDYAATLEEGKSRHLPLLPGLLTTAEALEASVGPVEIVYGHNDLLAANFIDDGSRLWLVDWDYAGFNSPLFDLANLASNNEFDGELERRLLTLYFGAAPEPPLLRAFGAMTCASLLRETLWSMVSEIHSDLDFDYGAYTAENLARFQRTHEAFAAARE